MGSGILIERLEKLYQIKKYFENNEIPMEKPHETRCYMGVRHGKKGGLPSGKLGFVIAVKSGGKVICDWQNGGVQTRHDRNWFDKKEKEINKCYPKLTVKIKEAEHSSFIYMAITVNQENLPNDLLTIFKNTKEIMCDL
jgi:hypothetical protein